MKNEDHRPTQTESSVTSGQALRQRAEAIVRDKEDRSAGDSAPPEDMRQELHELHVHQIELEMQNEELRRVQAELEDAWARYVDLYDFAPVGYCTLSSKGLIMEANLTAAKLLGVPRGELIHKPISRYILKEDQDIYYLHKLRLFETGEPQEYELRMIKRDGTAFWAHLASVTLQGTDDEPICRIILSDITKRKQAEEALRQSEERMRVLLNSMLDEVWYANKDKMVTLVNPAVLLEFGEASHGDTVEKIASRFEVYRQDGSPRPVEEAPPLRALSGEVVRNEDEIVRIPARNELRYRQVSASPVIDAGGNIIGSVSIVRDITELKKAAEALRESENRYRTMFETSGEGIVYATNDGVCVYCNQRFADMLGYPQDEIPGKTSADLNFASEQPEVLQIRKALIEGNAVSGEFRFRRKDGSELWTMYNSTPVFNAAGEIIGKFAMHTDITERKKAEEALAFQAHVLGSLHDAITAIDENYTITYWNDMAEQLFGWKAGEVLGQPSKDIFKTVVPNSSREEAISQMLCDDTYKGEIIYHHKNGSEIYTSVHSKVRRGANGEFKGTVTSFRDMTEQKRLMDQLEHSTEELQKKNKLVTEFFTNISHEFKTPLSVILIQLELMKMYMDDEKKMNEFIAAATQNSYRLTRLVSNLLDITKLDAGYLKANFANADIVSLIRDICGSVDLYAKARSIQLSNKAVMLNKVMPIDTEKIERIMLNILSNAIKHTGKDGKITVNVKDRKDGGVTISVEDTGEGIPPDKLNIIFDRFAQVNTSLTRQTEGSGIGLALVKSLVEILGGSIKVKSEVGKGSKFTIQLPLLEIASQTRFIEIEGYDLSKKTAMELSDLYLESI